MRSSAELSPIMWLTSMAVSFCSASSRSRSTRVVEEQRYDA
jgi:hypothetical protein